MLLYLFLCVFNTILGNIYAADFKAGHDLSEFIQQVCFAASYVQHFIPGLETIMVLHILGYLAPTAILTVATIAVFAIAVPEFFSEFLSDRGALRFVVVGDAFQVIPRGAAVDLVYEIYIWQFSSIF